MSIQEFLKSTLFTIKKNEVTAGDILVAFAIIAATWLLLKWLKKMLQLAQNKGRLNEGQAYAIHSLTSYVLYILAIIIALDAIHVRITILLAGSAALLVGIGLGLQQLAMDLVCGILILIENTIKINDVIEIDGTVARVMEIGLRTSKVETRDGITYIIPNSKITGNKMINWSMNRSSTRFSVKVGVAYGSDVPLVRKLLLEAATLHKDVAANPKVFCRLIEFGNSSLDFELFFWSKNRFRIEDVKSDIRFTIEHLFRENGVTIPFPQQDIYIKQNVKNTNS